MSVVSQSSRRQKNLTPLTCVIPVHVNNIEQLAKDSGLVADRLKVFLHQIYFCWIYNQLNDKIRKTKDHKAGWVVLSSVRLQVVVGKNYKQYEDALVKNDLIEVKLNKKGNKSCIHDKEATKFRIIPSLIKPHFGRRFRHELITNYRVLRSIDNYHRLFNNREDFEYGKKALKYCSVHKKMKDYLQSFYFDVDALGAYLSKLEEGKITTERENDRSLFDSESLAHIINEGVIKQPTVCFFGERFHSAFVRLPREYRSFLRMRGVHEHLASIDISNCQPFLVSLLISYPEQLKKVLPEFEVVLDKLKSLSTDKNTRRHYSEECKNGNIYEFWQASRGLKERNQAKDEIIKRILFPSTTYNQDEYKSIRRLFKFHFPDVWDAIHLIKNIDEIELPLVKDICLNKVGEFGGKNYYHKTISCMCQRLESRIMTGMVVPSLIGQGLGPFLTIHDSIVLPESKTSLVENTIIDCFKRLGVIAPKVKIKVYKPIPSVVDQ